MKKLEGKGSTVIAWLYIIFIIFNFISIFLYSFIQKKYGNIILLIISILVLLFLIWMIKNKWKKNYSKLFYSIIALSVVFSIMLLFVHYHQPKIDYLTFYGNGKALVTGSPFSDQYVAIFPYLWGYIALLGGVFTLFGTQYVVVVATNLVLNYLAAFFLYRTLRFVWNKKSAQIGTSLWLLNPLNYIWCTFAFGGTAFNAFLLGAIFFSAKLLKSENHKKGFLNAILFGLFLGLANQFRPIAIVYFIALVLYEGYQMFFVKGRKYSIALATFLIAFLMYAGINMFANYTLERKTGYKPADSAIGWSVYCGADLTSMGGYSFDGAKILEQEVLKQPFDAEKIHSAMLEKGLNSYYKNGLQNIKLFVNKFRTLAASVGDYSWEQLKSNVNSKLFEKVEKPLFPFVNLYYYFLLCLNLVCGYFLWKNKQWNFLVILILFVGGFTMANLFLEVAPRYFLPVMAPFTICATYGLCEWIKNKDRNAKKIEL